METGRPAAVRARRPSFRCFWATLKPRTVVEKTRERFLSMSLEDHMQMYLDEGLDKKAAMKAVAGDRGVSKSEIYKRLLDRKVP